MVVMSLLKRLLESSCHEMFYFIHLGGFIAFNYILHLELIIISTFYVSIHFPAAQT